MTAKINAPRRPRRELPIMAVRFAGGDAHARLTIHAPAVSWPGLGVARFPVITKWAGVGAVGRDFEQSSGAPIS